MVDFKKYLNQPPFEIKTSEEWSKTDQFNSIKVLDADGWNRDEFQYSWFEELISAKEYEKRMTKSTCIITDKAYKNTK